MTARTKIALATAAAAALGAIPAPTSIAITALQAWLVSSLREGTEPEWFATPLLARRAGTAAWLGLMKTLGGGTPVGMIAGAAIAAAGTFAIGCAARPRE